MKEVRLKDFCMRVTLNGSSGINVVFIFFLIPLSCIIPIAIYKAVFREVSLV